MYTNDAQICPHFNLKLVRFFSIFNNTHDTKQQQTLHYLLYSCVYSQKFQRERERERVFGFGFGGRSSRSREGGLGGNDDETNPRFCVALRN